ncbi:response regulator [Hymenobacter cellulosilyticus]|uniref:Response regulator transcription factor n=1 Tax=Hymenobacter cellulosilyticus TaxID=2932248 RepID=A0A8T9Q8K1_9BACT|nr:response regulator transcription factor [Hymenobacter cellulosilyticus]UOQ72418.1 response regulator transcription factor [Hymenobacter cellulosilyticus]
MPSSPCRLLIVDDHLMLTQSLALLFAGQPDLVVVDQLASGTALLEWLGKAVGAAVPADVLLLDLHLPGPDGLTLLPTLQQYPQLRVLVFSTAASPELIERVAAAGAHGFVAKSADAEHLLESIRRVHAGQRVFPRAPAGPPPRAAKLPSHCCACTAFRAGSGK